MSKNFCFESLYCPSVGKTARSEELARFIIKSAEENKLIEKYHVAAIAVGIEVNASWAKRVEQAEIAIARLSYTVLQLENEVNLEKRCILKISEELKGLKLNIRRKEKVGLFMSLFGLVLCLIPLFGPALANGTGAMKCIADVLPRVKEFGDAVVAGHDFVNKGSEYKECKRRTALMDPSKPDVLHELLSQRSLSRLFAGNYEALQDCITESYGGLDKLRRDISGLLTSDENVSAV